MLGYDVNATKGIRLPIFILAVVLSVLVPLVIHLAFTHLQSDSSGVTLSGSWEECVSSNSKLEDFSEFPNIQDCNWRIVQLPISRRETGLNGQNRVFYFRKKFLTPKMCENLYEPCVFFAGDGTDFAQVWINKVFAGNHGGPVSQHKSLMSYPIRISLPAKVLEKSTSNIENEILIVACSYSSFSIPLDIGPISIVSSSRSLHMAEVSIGGVVILSILSSYILLLMAVTGVFIWLAKGGTSAPKKEWIAYCFVSCLYLFSLSRIPRTHLPYEISTGFHVFLRVAYDLTFSALIASYFGMRTRILRLYQIVCLLWLAALTVFILRDILSSVRPFPTVLTGSFALQSLRLCHWLMLFSPVYGLVAIAKTKSDEPLRGLFFIFFSAVLLMQTLDNVAYLGLISEVYYNRFFPPWVAALFVAGMVTSYFKRLTTIEIEASLSVMAAQVAHDIRSPLALLNTVTRRGIGAPPEEKELINMAVSRIRGIFDRLQIQSTIVNNSASARSSLNPKTQVARESIESLEEVLHSILQEKIATLTPSKKIEFTKTRQGVSALHVICEKVEFGRIISNLIDNSIDSIAHSGSIHLHIEIASKRILVRILDSGRGVDSSFISRIGEKGATFGKPGGSGLGIFHAKCSVENWGGGLEIESSQGVGTTVCIHLLLEDR